MLGMNCTTKCATHCAPVKSALDDPHHRFIELRYGKRLASEQAPRRMPDGSDRRTNHQPWPVDAALAALA
jgi:hypothetical protein